MNEQKVTYYENPVFDILKIIKSKGYVTGSSRGVREENFRLYDKFDSKTKIIGILKPFERKTFFDKILNTNSKYNLHIGNLTINLPTELFLEVYGREYVTELSGLVKEIGKPMNTKIEIELGQEYPKREVNPSD